MSFCIEQPSIIWAVFYILTKQQPEVFECLPYYMSWKGVQLPYWDPVDMLQHHGIRLKREKAQVSDTVDKLRLIDPFRETST